MLEKLLEMVQGKPIARVVAVDLATGVHECYDLRPGGILVLETQGNPPELVSMFGRKG